MSLGSLSPNESYNLVVECCKFPDLSVRELYMMNTIKSITEKYHLIMCQCDHDTKECEWHEEDMHNERWDSPAHLSWVEKSLMMIEKYGVLKLDMSLTEVGQVNLMLKERCTLELFSFLFLDSFEGLPELDSE